jgi:hypothetical protein
MCKLAGIAVLGLLTMAVFTALLRFGYIPWQGTHSSKLTLPLPDASPEEASPSQAQLQSHQELEMEIEGDTRTESLSGPQPNDRLEPATSAMESAKTPQIHADEHGYSSSDTPTRESPDTRTTAEGFTPETASDEARSLEPGPERDTHIFEIEAVEKCWIKVRVDNTRVDEVLLRPGAKREWEAAESIQVSLGNAGGVCMKWDGKLLAPVGKSGQVIHFLLPNTDLIQKAQPPDGSRCDVFETMPGAGVHGVCDHGRSYPCSWAIWRKGPTDGIASDSGRRDSDHHRDRT